MTRMRQSRSKCNIFGQARRPAPKRTCRGDSPWSPGSKKIDFDAALKKMRREANKMFRIWNFVFVCNTAISDFGFRISRLQEGTMPSDIELINQLEKEIGRKLEERKFEEIGEYGQKGYAIVENGEVVGLNLDTIELKPVPVSLSKFHHLKKLNLINTNLTDISFLQGLSNLTQLDLRSNQIKNISFLQGLSNLTNLYLGANQITDISFLQGLSNLTHLILMKNQITDISFLKGLSNLTLLFLSLNQITDISFLKGLSNLERLDLRNNQIKELPDSNSNFEKIK